MKNALLTVVRYTDGLFEFLTAAGTWSEEMVDAVAVPSVKKATALVNEHAALGILCDAYSNFGEINEEVEVISPLTTSNHTVAGTKVLA